MLEATMENPEVSVDREHERILRWDSFLDAYSSYMRDRSAVNAVTLHLAAVAVAVVDPNFSVQTFEDRLGWNMSLADRS